jgi:hypothetical protein
MIVADASMLVVKLDDVAPTTAFTLGFEAGAFAQLYDDQLDGFHSIHAANATIIELIALGRGFTMDVLDSHEDLLLIQLSRAA